MQSLWQDLRYGIRGIRANPGFSLLAILTLALGIGAGTTMFSVIKNVIMSPFPYKDAERIAAFSIHDLESARPGGRQGLKAAEYLEYRQQNHVFSGDTAGGNGDVLWTRTLDDFLSDLGLWLVGIGLAVGLAASLLANKVLSSELWGVSARDPLTFAAVSLVVLAAGIAACWFPARRATRIDPMIALRFE